MVFRDRYEAGRVLAGRLAAYSGRPDVVVLGLPRGGVPVAWEVATRIGASLDTFTVRKLGVPGHEELAMGAIASGDVLVVNQELVRALGISGAVLEQVAERERLELARRERLYRDGRALRDVHGKTVLLVDDGLATGSTMRAAVAALRQFAPAKVVIAVPVASPGTCAELRREVDDLVCPLTPDPFYGVGAWYEDFGQTSDDEVRRLLTPPTAAEAQP
jgi:putative phosphoribosyl transferase